MKWQARWIWAKRCLNTPNFYLYARKEIEISAVSEATAFVTCASEYRLYVNGRPIGHGPAPSDPPVREYDTHGLTRALRRGKNCIAAICHNRGETPGGFLLQIELVRNGKSTVIAADETWKVKPADDWDFGSSRIAPGLGYQEIYDCARKPVGWNVVGFDDSGWEDAFVAGDAGMAPWTELVPREIPLLREREVFPDSVASGSGLKDAKGLLSTSGEAAVANPGRKATVALDFGREVVGFPLIRIRDSGRAVINATFDEGESEHASQVDRFALCGGRRELQTFGRRVFRRMRLTFSELDGPLHIESVSVNAVGYPVELVSTFECSDDRINEAWRSGVHTLGLSMQDDYECCPLTDPAPHPGDARVQALANYCCFLDSALAAKELRRFSSQPEPAWVVMLHDHYLHTGDRSLVQHLYPSLQAALDCPEASRQDAASLALLYQALRDAAKLASTVGAIDDAVDMHDRAERVRDQFNDLYWSDELGAYAEGGPNVEASVLAVLFGLADASKSDQLREFLPKSPHCATSRTLAFYLPQAMLKLGLERECLELLRTEHLESSAYLLPAEVLGVKPSMPESGVVAIQPRVGDLAWARGRVKTQRSSVEIEWQHEPGRFTIDIDTPEGFIVGLPVHMFKSPVIDEIDLSPETPERRARRSYGWGTTIWRDGTEHDPYMDWLVTQEADPPEDYLSRKRCEAQDGYVWVRESLITHVRYLVQESR